VTDGTSGLVDELHVIGTLYVGVLFSEYFKIRLPGADLFRRDAEQKKSERNERNRSSHFYASYSVSPQGH
jgi:hypothetical protein